MGLGIKPPPVTEAVPVSPPPPPLAVPKPAEPKLAEPETRPTVPPRQLAAVPRLEVEPQVSTPAPPRAAPVVRKAAVNTPSDARYVRRIATPPPPVVLRSYTATSYTSYMRSGAIWKKHQLEGR